MSYIKVKATNIAIKAHNLVNRSKPMKPSIDRINDYKFNHMGKYYVGPSAGGQFLQVNDGLHIRYYGNPFWNLYRVVSKQGTDFVIHQAK
jgi:hypothetical protein